MHLRSDDNKTILCQQFELERSLILKIRLSNVTKIKIIISMINTNEQRIKKYTYYKASTLCIVVIGMEITQLKMKLQPTSSIKPEKYGIFFNNQV